MLYVLHFVLTTLQGRHVRTFTSSPRFVFSSLPFTWPDLENSGATTTVLSSIGSLRYAYARLHFNLCLTFISQDFMIQTGDPTGTGRGGTSIYGQKFEDEISPELRFVGAGILAMGAPNHLALMLSSDHMYSQLRTRYQW
jgi:hypothetical protein